MPVGKGRRHMPVFSVFLWNAVDRHLKFILFGLRPLCFVEVQIRDKYQTFRERKRVKCVTAVVYATD